MQWLQMFLEEQQEIPWTALRFVIGQIVYGGRVTDPWDRRTLLSLLQTYLRPEVIAEGHLSGGYTVPSLEGLPEHVRFLEGFPLHDDPEVFGLHPNANVTYQLEMCGAMLDTLTSIQPRAVRGVEGGPTPEQVVAQKVCPRGCAARAATNRLPRPCDPLQEQPTFLTLQIAGATNSWAGWRMGHKAHRGGGGGGVGLGGWMGGWLGRWMGGWVGG